MLRAFRPEVAALYTPGLRYRKTGIVFFGLEKPGTAHQLDLFADASTPAPRQSALYKAVDALNAKYGKGKVFSAAEGIGKKSWHMKRQKLTPCPTTRWNELIATTRCFVTCKLMEFCSRASLKTITHLRQSIPSGIYKDRNGKNRYRTHTLSKRTLLFPLYQPRREREKPLFYWVKCTSLFIAIEERESERTERIGANRSIQNKQQRCARVYQKKSGK